jgi:hypothetical protein
MTEIQFTTGRAMPSASSRTTSRVFEVSNKIAAAAAFNRDRGGSLPVVEGI